MDTQKVPMKYNHLGKSGIKVSTIGLGFMDIQDQNLITQLVKTAWENGVNFFDNAEFYGQGKVETFFGNALKELKIPREDIVISTKIFWGGQGVNRVGLSRKHIIEGATNSLKRLQLDYVDIIMAHRFDSETPLEEICRAFDWLIRHGKALYWGTSEWPAKKLWEAIGICEKLGLVKPIADQCEYSMLNREKMEVEYIDLFDEVGFGTTVWSPLCGGILTGKYNKEVPQDSRYATAWYKSAYDKWLGPQNIENTRVMLNGLEAIAKELGCSMAQLALAWVIKNKDVSTALIGSSKVSQLEENLKALQFVDKITPDIAEKIEEVLKNRPDPGMNTRTFAKNPYRR